MHQEARKCEGIGGTPFTDFLTNKIFGDRIPPPPPCMKSKDAFYVVRTLPLLGLSFPSLRPLLLILLLILLGPSRGSLEVPLLLTLVLWL